MSEEDKVRKKNIGTVEVTIDRSEELKSVESENAELKNTLASIANKAFEDKCAKYGLDPKETSPEALKTVVAMHEQVKGKAPRGGDTAPLNQSQIEGKTKIADKFTDIPISLLEFDSEEEMCKVVKAISEDPTDPRQAKAKTALRLLAQKSLSQSQEFELEGSISDWARHGNKAKPRFIPVKPKENDEIE